MNIRHWFHCIFLVLLVFLSWSVFFSVFLTYSIQIPGSTFIKEILLLILGLLLVYLKWKEAKQTGKNPWKIGTLDILILSYIIVMVFITMMTTGIRGLIYGGRYDMSFLVAFLIAYHGFVYLQKPISYYINAFLLSGGIMLFISGLLKFPLQEELLLYFGYSPSISAWQFGDAPPMFHGIDGANVRRFQGLLDGPNSMGAFLIMYMGVLMYSFRYKKNWHFVIGVIVLGLIIMLLYTYSRSAMLGLIAMAVIAIVMMLGILFKKYKVQVISVLLMLGILGAVIFMMYGGTSQTILGREGSTKGHAERMKVGIERFISEPVGQGMGSAGPAYRHVLGLHSESRAEIEERDRYYIPESWYIQQYIEGGIVGGTLFLLIMAVIFWKLLMLHPLLGAMFTGIGVMNFFLHTFESSAVSLSLFLVIGMVLAYGKKE